MCSEKQYYYMKGLANKNTLRHRPSSSSACGTSQPAAAAAETHSDQKARAATNVRNKLILFWQQRLTVAYELHQEAKKQFSAGLCSEITLKAEEEYYEVVKKSLDDVKDSDIHTVYALAAPYAKAAAEAKAKAKALRDGV
jgi:hypothetical protein